MLTQSRLGQMEDTNEQCMLGLICTPCFCCLEPASLGPQDNYYRRSSYLQLPRQGRPLDATNGLSTKIIHI